MLGCPTIPVTSCHQWYMKSLCAVLMIMALWHAEIIDVKGAFPKASFDPKHKVYMEIPKGFEKFYPKNVLLLLKKTLYGVKNAAKAF